MAAPLIRVTFLLFFGLGNTSLGHAIRVEDIPRYRFVIDTVNKILMCSYCSSKLVPSAGFFFFAFFFFFYRYLGAV